MYRKLLCLVLVVNLSAHIYGARGDKRKERSNRRLLKEYVVKGHDVSTVSKISNFKHSALRADEEYW